MSNKYPIINEILSSEIIDLKLTEKFNGLIQDEVYDSSEFLIEFIHKSVFWIRNLKDQDIKNFLLEWKFIVPYLDYKSYESLAKALNVVLKSDWIIFAEHFEMIDNMMAGYGQINYLDKNFTAKGFGKRLVDKYRHLFYETIKIYITCPDNYNVTSIKDLLIHIFSQC